MTDYNHYKELRCFLFVLKKLVFRAGEKLNRGGEELLSVYCFNGKKILMKKDFLKQSKKYLFGVFRRGNKPSVLPREEKRAERQKNGELDASRKTLKREEPPV